MRFFVISRLCSEFAVRCTDSVHDEPMFSENAIQNFHNNHVWTEENPNVITEHHLQYQISVNVWAGIIDDYLIGLP